MIILACGDRNWLNRTVVYDQLIRIYENSPEEEEAVLISGAAPGADTIAADVGRKIGFTVKEFPADWEQYGKAAGPIRNRKMLDEKPELVIAFHSNLKSSRGTIDTIFEANRRGIPVFLVSDVRPRKKS